MDIYYSLLSLSFIISCMDGKSVVDGKVLEPIYWNSSNSKFKIDALSVDVELEDKLDIICPLKTRDLDYGQANWYYKIYLVDQHSYKTCNASGGRRLITCESPMYEKKYTFYFQEISPSPWALEFEADKTYYIISTSDGSQEGLNQRQGGSCVTHNMRVQVRVHRKFQDRFEEKIKKSDNVLDNHENLHNIDRDMSENQHNFGQSNKINDDQTRKSKSKISKNKANPSINNYRYYEENNKNSGDHYIENISANTDDNNKQKPTKGKGQMILGIVVGAGVVIFILLLILVGYRVYNKRRRRDSKKYQYQQPNTGNNRHGIPSQVTLLPIQSVAGTRGHSRMDLNAQNLERGQLTRLIAPLNRSSDERVRQAGMGQFDLRSPPPYNESFLDNGGSVVAV